MNASWIFTTDHKRIGILYLVGSLAVFVAAGIVALLMRAELTTIGPTLTDDPGVYNVWLYFHGAGMILGYQIPALTGFLGNYLVPLMIGAREVAFPRLNALALWLFYSAVLLALATFAIPDPPDVLWTGYPPYSVITSGNTAFYTLTVLLLGFSSILTGVNLLTTIIFMRAKNVTWHKLPVFVWSIMGAFVLQLVFLPVLGAAVAMVSLDKYFGSGFFQPFVGGEVLVYQNLFWFYGHPAVYVVLLPFLGIVYDIVATFSRNRVFNYRVVVYVGMGGVTLLAGEVWVHHLFTTGMPDWLRVAQMVLSLMISIPVGILMIGLIGTLYRGAIDLSKTPMLYAIGVVFLFLIGGLTGMPNAIASIDLHVQDTYFVVGHFHYVMAAAGTFALFGAIYYLFPKITGRMYNETLGKLGFWTAFIGTNVLFFVMMQIGAEGMPRRYFDYAQFPQFEDEQRIMSAAVVLIAISVAVTLYSWLRGAIAGEAASDNPWESCSLEWTAPSPPPPGNWPQGLRVLEDWHPYGYAQRAAAAGGADA